MLMQFTGLFRTWDDEGVRDLNDYKKLPVGIEVQQVESVNPSMFPGVCTLVTKSGKSHLIFGEFKVLFDTVNAIKREENLCYHIGHISN